MSRMRRGIRLCGRYRRITRLTTASGGASPQGEAFWWPFCPTIISRCACSPHPTMPPSPAPPSSFILATFPSTRQVLCFFPCTPRATALRQARVSGGNLQNCAPSAACGGAMTQERNVTHRLPSSPPAHPRKFSIRLACRRTDFDLY